MFYWLVKFYVSPNKKSYLFNPQSIGEFSVAVPILCIVTPDIFSSTYMFIIISRFLRISVAVSILTGN